MSSPVAGLNDSSLPTAITAASPPDQPDSSLNAPRQTLPAILFRAGLRHSGRDVTLLSWRPSLIASASSSRSFRPGWVAGSRGPSWPPLCRRPADWGRSGCWARRPFALAEDWKAGQGADAVVTFWGRPRRRVSGIWSHQCGSIEEAFAAQAAGADAVIAQGHEAGGHVRGALSAEELLELFRARLDLPVFSAGGIATSADVRGRLGAGGGAVVAGTRFLMSTE